MTKHSMIDRVVFRAIRRKVSYLYFKSKTTRELPEFFAKQRVSVSVASATISQHKHFIGSVIAIAAHPVPPHSDCVTNQLPSVRALREQHEAFIGADVVDAIGDNLPIRMTPEVVIESMNEPTCAARTRPVEIAKEFLLFRVDADDWKVPEFIVLSQVCDHSKLSVAIGCVSQGGILQSLPASQPEFIPQQMVHGIRAGTEAFLRQRFRDIARRTVRPQLTWAYRRAGRIAFNFLLTQNRQTCRSVHLRGPTIALHLIPPLP